MSPLEIIPVCVHRHLTLGHAGQERIVLLAWLSVGMDWLPSLGWAPLAKVSWGPENQAPSRQPQGQYAGTPKSDDYPPFPRPLSTPPSLKMVVSSVAEQAHIVGGVGQKPAVGRRCQRRGQLSAKYPSPWRGAVSGPVQGDPSPTPAHTH